MGLRKNFVISMICIVFRSENHRMGAFEFEIELFFKLNLLNVFIKLWANLDVI